jgi:hypothetical protein
MHPWVCGEGGLMAYEDLDSRLEDSNTIRVILSDLEAMVVSHPTTLDPDSIASELREYAFTGDLDVLHASVGQYITSIKNHQPRSDWECKHLIRCLYAVHEALEDIGVPALPY